MMKKDLIVADVVFVPPEMGGRSQPPQSLGSQHYRPHLHPEALSPDGWHPEAVTGDSTYLGVCFVDGPEEVEHSELYRVELQLLYGVDYSPLVKGCTFTIREGARAVGFGVVTEGLESPAILRS
ncbi:MAG: hypothetical protein A3K19_31910 [Lentisphaerae bacterium RIFOXYB12_FULL_65_16]|nr:MAG: hypothetical protein A3K18_10690 [Lentisphaerae bacterium RIFOXYA12_64_32]OGV88707.1 MAG: hypothetical protein A3K19_31910 [Lentisphaerae bacterium RIFOXYB12_FULL_65_16]